MGQEARTRIGSFVVAAFHTEVVDKVCTLVVSVAADYTCLPKASPPWSALP